MSYREQDILQQLNLVYEAAVKYFNPANQSPAKKHFHEQMLSSTAARALAAGAYEAEVDNKIELAEWLA